MIKVFKNTYLIKTKAKAQTDSDSFCSFLEQRCTGIVDSIADGICDDANTNIECYFDGGDCCFNPITMCDDCFCLYGKKELPTYVHNFFC